MTVRTSKLKNGTLTLGDDTESFSAECQATNVRLVPEYETEDGVETLCGDREPDTLTETWTLEIEAIQDFTDPAGFQAWTWEHAGQVVPYSWKPNATGPTFSGTVQVYALAVGGEVGARLTESTSWPCLEKPTRTENGAPAAAPPPAPLDV